MLRFSSNFLTAHVKTVSEDVSTRRLYRKRFTDIFGRSLLDVLLSNFLTRSFKDVYRHLCKTSFGEQIIVIMIITCIVYCLQWNSKCIGWIKPNRLEPNTELLAWVAYSLSSHKIFTAQILMNSFKDCYYNYTNFNNFYMILLVILLHRLYIMT